VPRIPTIAKGISHVRGRAIDARNLGVDRARPLDRQVHSHSSFHGIPIPRTIADIPGGSRVGGNAVLALPGIHLVVRAVLAADNSQDEQRDEDAGAVQVSFELG
jgi:hypothetical protein